MTRFTKIAKMHKDNLKGYLDSILQKKYDTVYNGDGYLFAIGQIPVLVTAHMDTVHKDLVKKVNTTKYKGKTYINSPQGIGGDDRCGIWVILELLKKGYRPYVLFCEDEEIGRVGAKKFCKTELKEILKECKYFIELDRKGYNEAVFYDCGNEGFQKYICDTTGFELDYGSYSDISELSPETDIASVNISVGYYDQHTLKEIVVYEEMANTVSVVEKLFADIDNVKQFDYQEKTYRYYDGWGVVGNRPLSFSDNFYFEIVFVNNEGKEDYYGCEATSIAEATGKWIISNPDLSYSKNFLDYFVY